MKQVISEEQKKSILDYMRENSDVENVDLLLKMMSGIIDKVNSLSEREIPEITKEQLIYFRLFFLRYKIRRSHAFYLSNDANSLTALFDFFDVFEINVIALNNLIPAVKESSSYFKNSGEMIELKKSLLRKLEFINHIRNKSFGHLDASVFRVGVTWVPQVYFQMPENFRIFGLYKGLIESAINTYCDKDNNQKMFNHEIDISYPQDWHEFLEFLESINVDSMRLLDFIINQITTDFLIDPKSDDAYLRVIKAAKVDFFLKH